MRSGWLVPVVVVALGCYLAVMFGALNFFHSGKRLFPGMGGFHIASRGTNAFRGFFFIKIFEQIADNICKGDYIFA